MRQAALPLLAVLALSGALAACAPARSVPEQATGAELQHLLAQERLLYQRWYLYSLSSGSTTDPVEFEKMISPSEAEQVYARCMTDAGFPGYGQAGTTQAVERSADGQQALYRCVTRFPLDPSTFGLFSEAQLDYLYDYYRETLLPCLDTAGFAATTVPTRGEFLSRTPAQLYAWSPYQSIGFVPPDTLTSLAHRCPEYPNGLLGD